MNFYIILLFLLSLLPLMTLIHPGLPLTHDGQDHVARIANFYQNLHEGILVPRWAPNLNWGYGHPILMFLYPLPSYLASLFHSLGFSFIESTKLVFAISFIISSLTMFLWLKEFLPRNAAFIGAILYIFAPYRFVDLYVRGAIGEHVAFIFPPIIFYCLFKLSKKYSYKYFALGVISIACLILSHNAISLMFLPIILLYILYLVWNSKKSKSLLLNSCFLILLGFSLSAFFWLPAYVEGKYTLRDIVTKGGFENNFANFSQFIYGPWNYGISGQFTLQVGILHWISVLLAIPGIFYLYKKKNKLWIMALGLLIIFCGSLILIDTNSRFIWEKITLIQKFQFPWRFLSITVFSSAVLGAIVVSFSSKKYLTIITLLLTLGVLYINKDYWHAKGYQNKPENFYTSVYPGTTDTGESAPIWSVRFMEQKPKAHMEVIGGKAEINEVERKTTVHKYRITAHNKVQLRENTLYFPGWTVLVDNNEVPIQYQDSNNRGVMTFLIPKGTHDIAILFKETKLRLIADYISIISLFALLGLGILRRRLWRN